jgi:hypothetical protein
MRDVTYAKLNWHGEEFTAGQARDLSPPGNAGKIDVRRLDDAMLALEGLEKLISEAAEVCEPPAKTWA